MTKIFYVGKFFQVRLNQIFGVIGRAVVADKNLEIFVGLIQCGVQRDFKIFGAIESRDNYVDERGFFQEIHLNLNGSGVSIF